MNKIDIALFWICMFLGVLLVFTFIIGGFIVSLFIYPYVSPFIVLLALALRKELRGWILGFYYGDSKYFPSFPIR